VAQSLIDLHNADLEPEVSQKYRAGDTRHCIADITKISAHGYEPRMSFDRSIREFYEWSKTQESKDSFKESEKHIKKRGLTG
jgi:dTDP-L-rhamnose 4-epimerase